MLANQFSFGSGMSANQFAEIGSPIKAMDTSSPVSSCASEIKTINQGDYILGDDDGGGSVGYPMMFTLEGIGRQLRQRADAFQVPMRAKNDEYRELFHLPQDETLIEDFNCALQKKILLQEEEEKMAAILQERKEKEAKKKALKEEQAAKLKKMEKEMAREKERLKKEEEEKLKEVDEEEEGPPLQKSGQHSGSSSDEMEKKISEWVANLSLGEEEEVAMYIPKDEQEAAMKKWEAEEDVLTRPAMEDEQRMAWKLAVMREKKRRVEAANATMQELAEAYFRLEKDGKVEKVLHSLTLLVEDSLPFDIVLGMDWGEAVGATLHLKEHECRLPSSAGEAKTARLFHVSGVENSLAYCCLSALAFARLVKKEKSEEQVFVAYVRPVTEPTEEKPMDPAIAKLLEEFKDLTEPPTGTVPRPIQHRIEIEPGSRTPKGAVYRMSPRELEELRKQLDELLQKGWIRPSSSPFGAPVLFVPKKEGELRMKFVRNFSTIAAPLRRLLRKETIWKWDKDCTSAMKKLKQALIEYPVLKVADPSLPFVVTTDASQYGIGAVLQQDDGNGYRPVEFMSDRMPSEKVATSTYERELYALRQALDHWKHYLLGRHFKGHMYLFDRFVCFYSNIFGYEKKKVIPLKDVTCVRKAKTAGVFPNAIEITALGKRHFFASFLSRDEAYRLIINGWGMHSGYAKLFLGGDHPSSNPAQSRAPSEASEEMGTEGSSNCQSLSSIDGLPGFREDGDQSGVLSKEMTVQASHARHDSMDALEMLPFEGERRCSRENEGGEGYCVRDDDAMGLDDRGNAGDILVSACAEDTRRASWIVEDLDPPVVTESHKKIVEEEFPIRVKDFFDLFFSDDSVGFLKNFHKSRDDEDFRCSRWAKHRQLGFARDITFRHPIRHLLGPKSTYCHQTQLFRVFRHGYLVIESTQVMTDIPYGDYFHIEGRWDVETLAGEGGDHCFLRIYINVPFSKRTYLRSKIEQGAIDECRETYMHWVREAKVALADVQPTPLSGTPRLGFGDPNEEEVDGLGDACSRSKEPSGRRSIRALDKEAARVLSRAADQGIPKEYEQDIRRMLKLDRSDSKSESVSRLNRGGGSSSARPTSMGDPPDPLSREQVKACQTVGSSSFCRAFTDTKWDISSLGCSPGSYILFLLQTAKKKLTALDEQRKGHLKTGLCVLAVLLIITLQHGKEPAWQSSSSEVLPYPTGSSTPTGGTEDGPLMTSYWEQKVRLLNEEIAAMEDRLQVLTQDLNLAKLQFQAEARKLAGTCAPKVSS
ncbi:hypothetical protein CBR_g3459 [Chara braunii]|uniref:VASt domain-containing protein n=1 Tax=Chara braunii TaxID=69332 RepID=A0A388JQZ0_CHABU|nr:hypothetical protein CBR_g3459 [Chara braunii]|eukprot:GBG60215.1 hypothetical protein CBR_g3459 [Chara braunii]